MRLFFKKLVITSRTHISNQFIEDNGSTDFAILHNKDTFEPNPMVYAPQEASSSKDTWGMVLLIVPRTSASPFSFWHSHSHVLLCTHP